MSDNIAGLPVLMVDCACVNVRNTVVVHLSAKEMVDLDEGILCYAGFENNSDMWFYKIETPEELLMMLESKDPESSKLAFDLFKIHYNEFIQIQKSQKSGEEE